MKEYKIHISNSNSKLGKIPSFSTTPVIGCGKNCAVCAGKCYALKSYKQYPAVKTAWDDNFGAVLEKQYYNIRRSVVEYCNRKNIPVFRWFVAGDIYDRGMLVTMTQTAIFAPNTIFYAYTKCYDVVNECIRDGGNIPENLTIIFSAWDGLEMDNPYNFPVSDVILKGTNKDMAHNSHVCPNQKNKAITCDRCPVPCWHAQPGETVYFMEH